MQLPLRPEVQEELDQMESLGVIPKVDEPILWCTGIGDGANERELHICIDLKLLNSSLANWTSIVGFGRFHTPGNHGPLPR